jgi:hypothetical protein
MPCDRSSRNIRRAILHTASRSTLFIASDPPRSTLFIASDPSRSAPPQRSAGRRADAAPACADVRAPLPAPAADDSGNFRAVANRPPLPRVFRTVQHSEARAGRRRGHRAAQARGADGASAALRTRHGLTRGSAARLDTWRTTWQMAYKRATRRRDVHAAQRARARGLAWGRSARECGASEMADCATCGPPVPTGLRIASAAATATSAPGLYSACHICARTGLAAHAAATSAPGPGPPLPHLRRGRARSALACDSPPVCNALIPNGASPGPKQKG